MALGKSSLVISMPKAWLELNRLGKGDEVSLDIQSDGALIVHSMLKQRSEVKEFHIGVETGESEESIARRIIAAFLDGYTMLRLS